MNFFTKLIMGTNRPESKPRSVYLKETIAFKQIWNNKSYNDFGLERMLRLELILSSFIMPGTLIRQLCGRKQLLIRKVVITYTPADPKKEEFKKIEMLVSTELNPDGTNKVSNILAERIISNREGFLQKKLLWKMDRSFLVVTVSQAPGKPEISSTTRVTWNEEELP